MQRAGDAIPASEWSLPGQFPRFILPTLDEVRAGPGERLELYLHIPHRIPASFRINLMTSAQLMHDMQWGWLLLGITFGAMLLAALVSAAFMVLHRDRIFVWYGLYAVAALFACLTHSGIAFHLLWPHGGLWPSTALLFFMLMAAACQLQFAKLLFISDSKARIPVRASEALGVLNVAVALIFPWISMNHWVAVLFLAQGLVVLSMLGTATLVIIAWRRGNHLARALMLTFVPLFATVCLGLLEGQSLVNLPQVSYNAPIYAAALEVILLGLVLQWFARERHGEVERERALASTDPLTGFLTAAHFHQALRQAWSDAQRDNTDVSIAYVELPIASFSKRLSDDTVKRTVRILRTVTDEADTVGRLDGQTLAILMPGVSINEKLSVRLSRIVALGLMPEDNRPGSEKLKFRIVATSRRAFMANVRQLDTDLRHLLMSTSIWRNKSIRILGGRQDSRLADFVESQVLADIWEEALQDELQPSENSTQPALPPLREPAV